jgi:hypothetical protein
MNGFLQRLVERAMGQSSPLRVAAASPFAHTLASAEPTLPLPELLRPETGAADTSYAPQTSVQPQMPTQTPIGQSRAARSPAERLARTRNQPAQPKASAADSRTPPAATMPLSVPVERAVTRDSGWSGPETPPQSLATSERQNASTAVAQPIPLLPPRPDAESSARDALRFDMPVRGHAATVEETTEVHVSIGRIEVTAVHEAAPPPRKTPRRNPPMSLDDYLARRNEDRP